MKVVFIIPCFNAEKNLDKLVNSVFSQVDDLWSAIFIDDSYENVSSAKNIGIVSHHYTKFEKLIQFLSLYT